MAATIQKDWRKEFGLDERKPPQFFSGVDQLDEAAGKAPQPHALRRAFEQLDIDGVFCQEPSPVIYFRQVAKIDAAGIVELHRAFWNQGIAAILVVIAPDEVHIYSGLVPPADTAPEAGQTPGCVETLKRVQGQLRSFLLSVESGEYFHTHRRCFDPRRRVDRELLHNLRDARQVDDRVNHVAPRVAGVGQRSADARERLARLRRGVALVARVAAQHAGEKQAIADADGRAENGSDDAADWCTRRPSR